MPNEPKHNATSADESVQASSQQPTKAETKNSTANALAQDRSAWKEKQKWGYENPKRAIPIKDQQPKQESQMIPEHEVAREENAEDHDDRIPSLRTYRRDAARAAQEQKQSAARIALAEKRRAEKGARDTTVKHRRRISLWRWGGIVVVVLLVLGGAVGGWYVFVKSPDIQQPDPQGTVNTPAFRSIILPDNYHVIPSDNISSAAFRQNVSDRIRSGGEVSQIQEIIPVIEGGATETQTIQRKLSTAQFIDIWDPAIPTSLVRALRDTYMLGSYTATRVSPFLILQTTSFSRGYAGLLAWEHEMYRELSALFGTQPESATTTRFVDAVVAGHDVRALRTAENTTLLLYTLPREAVTIITTNENTLRELVERMGNE